MPNFIILKMKELEQIILYLKSELKLKIESANFAQGYIPRDILLDRTRNIHSYIIPCLFKNEKIDSIYWSDTNFIDSIIALLRVQYSQLDRPLFFIIKKDNDYKIIEGNIIREYILENSISKTDLLQFILSTSNNLSDIIYKIKNEL